MKITSLAVFCLAMALSASAQTAKQHVNLGMNIDEFVDKFDVSGSNTPESRSFSTATREAMDGRRVTIQMNLEGRKTEFVFEKRTLCEIQVTAFNTYAHELQVLTAQLGASQVSSANTAVWDRRDGTRFTLTSREGTGVLRITPTPENR
jgi:hypothetical protein